jgi:hypothetical protein
MASQLARTCNHGAGTTGESIGSYALPNRGGRFAIQEKLDRLMKAMNAAGGSLDLKFLCQKVTPPLEFVTRPSEIGVFAKEGKQEILRGNHTNRDDALVR